MSQNGKPTLQELLDDTKCKHCGQTFHSVRVPVIGQQAKQFMEFCAKLHKHLAEKHPEVLSQIVMLQGQFNGMLLLNQYATADQQLNTEQDITRHKIFKLCQRVKVSDSTIEERVEQAIVDSVSGRCALVSIDDFIALVKQMRDVLGEVGLYPEPSPIITPGQNLPV